MEPYLSVVVPGRNDDYGGHFLERFTNFLTDLAVMADRHGLDTELIVVEWNPPADRPTFETALNWPGSSSHFQARLVTVPAEVHAGVEGADRIGFFEFHAKNVGIRRAAGPFVLATNADVLFNDELAAHLASRPLRDDRMYRISRWDVDTLSPEGQDTDERLRFCADHVYRRAVKDRFIGVTEAEPDRRRPGRGIFGSRRLAMEYEYATCAAGDFTLMSKRCWQQLRGYPQVPSTTKLDSYLIYMAVAAGLVEEVFQPPMRLYHQAHQFNNKALKRKERRTYRRERRKMLKQRRPIIRNDEHWGLDDQTLPDRRMV